MSLNPFNSPLPVQVMLRNRTFAVVDSLVEVGAYGLAGYGPFSAPNAPDRECTLLRSQLWRADNGRWHDTNAKHDLDIVATVVAVDLSTGKINYVPLSAAAGAPKEAK